MSNKLWPHEIFGMTSLLSIIDTLLLVLLDGTTLASFNASYNAWRRVCRGTCKFCRRFLFLELLDRGLVVFPFSLFDVFVFVLLLLFLLSLPQTHFRRPHSPQTDPSGVWTTCSFDVTECCWSNLPLSLILQLVFPLLHSSFSTIPSVNVISSRTRDHGPGSGVQPSMTTRGLLGVLWHSL